MLGIGASCFLLLFGAIVYFVRNFNGEDSSDLAKIEAVRNEIAKFRLPAGFVPAYYGRMGDLRGVAYGDPAIHGRLLLLESATKTHDRERESRTNLAEPLLNAKSHIKQIKIKGKECLFEFSHGIDPETRQMRRRVSDTFEGQGGPTTIEVEMDESADKEKEIVEMLEGIR